MLRHIFLFLVYLGRKIRDLGRIKYNGFTIIFSFPNSKISIGEGTIINSSPYSNMLGLFQKTIIVARYGGEINIGKHCGISGTTIYSISEIIIGDYCSIGANCKIVDNDFHPLEWDLRRKNLNEEYTKRKPIIIGHDCFIGMNSIILKGTHLGNNVIVGAGSIVTGTFPDNSVIAGNPAKIIKYLN